MFITEFFMILKRITSEFKDIELVNALAKEAFPPAEYLEPKKIIEMSEEIELDFWALYDEQKFVGFMTVFLYEDISYLFFLAIDGKSRSKGYGSKALAELEKKYPRYQQVVDLEMVEEGSSNNEQRITRRKFYIRNGYRATGCYLMYNEIPLEIMSKGEEFDFQKCQRLLSRIPIEGFEPKYFMN